MSPTTRPTVKKTGPTGRQVQPKVSSRLASSSVNLENHIQQFREARKLREEARLTKLRNCRLGKSTNVGTASSSTSTSVNSGNNAKKTLSNVPGAKEQNKPSTSRVFQNNRQFKAQVSQSSSNIQSIPKESKLQPQPFKLRRSHAGRKSIVKTRVRKMPRAEVKLTKTTQLRMLKNDPFLDISTLSTASTKQKVLPLPVPLTKKSFNIGTKDITDGVIPKPASKEKSVQPQPACGMNLKSTMKKVSTELQSPSRIPVRKTSFVSPLKRTHITPRPSPLREGLKEWLAKHNHPLDNFKHLKCFGILGPVVKRPQTPFCKRILSTSTLKAIPERAESTSNNSLQDSDEDVADLNTTFTLEEEDKENVTHVKQQESRVDALNVSEAQTIKELDQAHGVLSELHNLIHMGYPIEQCGLWLRAVRRRFPQCGDEPIYWECLASLEEARGDLQTAVSCYERAILQGAESSVQNTLDELLKKMSALQIEPNLVDVSHKKSSKVLENQSLNSSNIIRSSSIQFAVLEKCSSANKYEVLNDVPNTSFTATPVRRSMRLAGTPKKGTPGITCVRSLEFLEPEVRSALSFQNNSALDLKY